ncbi:hypothetical protein V2S66_14660 [Streptomyces sp. V4-01]|uniref:Secreted protein n=1 Tax=Actinacidiphila polyblastidii TaxID=3110430 RepID=A0ABU7PD47_9ACTN|nr:hypothetical protein [Streptomyces sp. V4-01]
MAALAWLIIPLVAAVAAAFWGRWAGRRRSTGDGASLAGYERFRTAMENAAAEAEAADAGTQTRDARAAAADARKAARKAARKGRTAAAQAQGEAGEEDSPRGPVAGPVP